MNFPELQPFTPHYANCIACIVTWACTSEKTSLYTLYGALAIMFAAMKVLPVVSNWTSLWQLWLRLDGDNGKSTRTNEVNSIECCAVRVKYSWPISCSLSQHQNDDGGKSIFSSLLNVFTFLCSFFLLVWGIFLSFFFSWLFISKYIKVYIKLFYFLLHTSFFVLNMWAQLLWWCNDKVISY